MTERHLAFKDFKKAVLKATEEAKAKGIEPEELEELLEFMIEEGELL